MRNGAKPVTRIPLSLWWLGFFSGPGLASCSLARPHTSHAALPGYRVISPPRLPGVRGHSWAHGAISRGRWRLDAAEPSGTMQTRAL